MRIVLTSDDLHRRLTMPADHQRQMYGFALVPNPEPNAYDTNRAPYDVAGPWDKTVRFVRARDKLTARGCDPTALLVAHVDGVAVLRDPDRPEMSETL